MRIVDAIKVAWAVLLNRYESGRRWTRERSALIGEVQDSRFDLDPATRSEMVRKSRWFAKNSWLMQRILCLYDQFVCGPTGLNMCANSSEPAWNIAADAALEKYKCRLAEIAAQVTQELCIDGECYLLKTRGQRTRLGTLPDVQVIRSHRVATPPHHFNDEGRTIIDGLEIERDNRGRLTNVVTHYWVRDFDSDMREVWERVPAALMLHVSDRCAPDEFRSPPMGFAGLDLLGDIYDLERLEMSAAKDLARRTNVFKSENSELPASLRGTGRFNVTESKTNAAGGTTTTDRAKYFSKVTGAETIAIGLAESLEQPRPSRPSAEVQAYWEYCIGAAAACWGLPKLVVWMPAKAQGTVARSDLDIANIRFQSVFQIVRDAMIWAREYFLEHEMRTNVNVADGPEDWNRVSVQPPAAINVDSGYNSAAAIAELNAGLKNYDMWYSPRGKSWRVELRQRAEEAAYIRSLADEFKVSVAEISQTQQDKAERIQTEPQDPRPPVENPGDESVKDDEEEDESEEVKA